jgi:DNA-binding NarL/FixJ family response regulator
MKVTTLIVDDEPVAHAGLRAMPGAFDWVSAVGEAADRASAVEAIDRLRPELVFLDVQMPGLLPSPPATRPSARLIRQLARTRPASRPGCGGAAAST